MPSLGFTRHRSHSVSCMVIRAFKLLNLMRRVYGLFKVARLSSPSDTSRHSYYPTIYIHSLELVHSHSFSQSHPHPSRTCMPDYPTLPPTSHTLKDELHIPLLIHLTTPGPMMMSSGGWLSFPGYLMTHSGTVLWDLKSPGSLRLRKKPKFGTGTH